MRRVVWLLLLLGLACGDDGAPQGAVGRVSLRSPAFPHGGTIPRRYTCDGPNVAPPLVWGPAPPGTRAWALVVTDPDAPGGRFVHWVLVDLPARARGVLEGGRAAGARQGRNDFGRLGWAGPCPPPGRPHRYVFTLYALRSPTGLPTGASAAELQRALSGRVVAVGQLVGRYGRGPR